MPRLSTRITSVAHLRVWLAMLGAAVACSAGSHSISGPSNASETDAALLQQVASISITPPTASGALGESTQFVAVARNANGDVLSGQALNWTSSDSTIVEISSTGLAVNVGIGSASITAAAANGISGRASQAVVGAPPVATLLVAPSQIKVGAGQTTRFSVTVKDAAGNVLTGRRVIWQSSDPSIMRVDSTGAGTPIGQGVVTISALSAGIAGAASADVSAAPTQSPGTVNDLTVVSTTDTSATIQFTQVSDGDGFAASYDIHVGVPPIDFNTSASVSRGSCASPLAGTGPTGQLTCTVFGLSPSTNYNLQLVAFRGTLNLNAVLGNPSNVAVATTGASRTVASVSVTPQTATASPGQQLALSATALNAAGTPIAGTVFGWMSSNSAVATVSSTGVVTAVAIGDAFITASSGSSSAQSHITVTSTMPGTVGNLTVSAFTDSSATLVFTQAGDGLGGAASYDVRWSTVPTSFATMASVTHGSCSTPVAGTTAGASLTCVVTGLSASSTYYFQLTSFRGTLNVNAVFGGASNVASITTAIVPAATVTVTPGSASINVGAGGAQFTAVVKDAQGNVLAGRAVTWTSSNPAVVSVSSSGNATGVTIGSATVTASSGSASGTATVTTSAAPGSVPFAVTTLATTAVTDTSASLSLVQVSDGAGGAANYEIRYSVVPINFNSAPDVSRGTCATPLTGTSVGSLLSCTVLGLSPGTTYNFEAIAFRGTLNVNAVFGALSNEIASATTTLTPVASVIVTPPAATTNIGSGGVQFTAVAKDASGNVLTGRPVAWASNNNPVATVSGTGLATGVTAGAAGITATIGSVASNAAALTVTTPVTNPGGVVDLQVLATTDTSATLKFTQVTDGAGGAASYDVRFHTTPIAWGSAASTTRGMCTTPVAGTSVGTSLTCTVFGLSASTSYDFQVIAFRGTLNVNAVFGALSNVASASTTLTPVASVTVTPVNPTTNVGSGGVQFTAVLKDAGGNVLSGRPIVWNSTNTAAATVSGTGLATAVGSGSTSISATSGAASGASTLTVTAPPPTPPGTVNDLQVTAFTDTSVTLQFTQVGDGTGAAAGYGFGYSVAPISLATALGVTKGSCSNPVAGTAIGAPLTCTVMGLTANTAYQFEVAAFRGTFNVNAVFGGVSNIASATTQLTPVGSVVVSPSSAAAVVGGTFPFTAIVKDVHNNVITGWPITWISGNPAIATVSGTGVATGVASGSTTINASAGGKGNAATITVTPPVPPPSGNNGSIAITRQPGNSTSGQALTVQPVVQLRDANNVLMSTSTAAVTVAIGSGTGTLSGTTTVNAVAGVATFTNITITGSGSFTLTFTSPLLTSATSNTITVSGAAPPPAGATKLGIATQPNGSVSGALLAPQPVIQVLDATSTLVATSSAAVTASLASGTGSLSGTTTVNAVNGVATFTNLAVTGGGGFQLKFSSTGLTQATSTTFTLTQTPVSIAMVTQPNGATSGSSFTQQPAVKILDGTGAVIPSSLAVTAAIATGTGTLAGTTTVNAVNGVATFTNLQITGSGNFTLTFSISAPALQTTSSSFAVTAATVTTIFQDNFETGDFSHTQNGVHWSSEVYLDVTTTKVHGGTHAARFREGDAGTWSELRFDGLANLADVYFQYYLYLPSGSEFPSVGPMAKELGTLNDKFFRLWGGGDDGYNFGGAYVDTHGVAQPYGNKVGASTWGDGTGTDGYLGREYEYSDPSGGPAGQWPMGQGPVGPAHPLVIANANRGRWVQIRIHVKQASAANNDGVLQYWVDGVLISNDTALKMGNIYGGANPPFGYTTGYILGAANNGWPAGQYVYLDDFTITTGGFGPP